MKNTPSVVVSMHLPAESGNRLKRMANRHGWTPSDASARLVEEGLRRSEFAFLECSTIGTQTNPPTRSLCQIPRDGPQAHTKQQLTRPQERLMRTGPWRGHSS